ncbi:MAG: hypothetical protein ABSG92_04335 [Conexivisphaerales archaeon]
MELSPANSQDSPVENLPPAIYDEQLGLTLAQSFTSIAYNVTAVAQADSNGYGPAYLLNGLTDTGYWYQVGLSWNWPYTRFGIGSYNSGFSMNYEVFGPGGNSIDPASGGGLSSFSGTVNQGDTVTLNLYFSGGNVVMLAYDYSTGAGAEQTFSQEGSSSFVGLASSPENRNGYFTGLMTEWWHSSAYYGGEAAVTYSDSSNAKSSAWMWMDEWNPGTGQSLFSASTSGPVAYSDPNTLQYLSSNGATEASDAYLFMTGGNGPVTVTVGYSVRGGGSGYSPPSFNYTFGGVQYSIQLSTTPTTIYMDGGSTWSVNGVLLGSTSNETWDTQQPTSGTAANGTTLSFVYFHQFQVSFYYAVANGGSGYSQPSVSVSEFGSPVFVTLGSSVFVDAGSSYSFQNPLPGSSGNEQWATQSATGVVGSSASFFATYYHQYALTYSYGISGGGSPTAPTLTATQFGSGYTPTLTSSATAYWTDSGQSWSVTDPLSGSGTSETWDTAQTTSGTVSGATTTAFTYYHQYYETVSYSISGGGSPSAPSFSYYQFGSPQSVTVTGSTAGYWADDSQAWSVTPNPLNGSSPSEQWVAAQTTSGTVSSSWTTVFGYNNQYYLNVSSTHGSPTGTGWYDASTTANFQISTPQAGITGVQYAYPVWTGAGAGSYSGTNNPGSVTMNNAINESASTWLQVGQALSMSSRLGRDRGPIAIRARPTMNR